MLEQNTKKIILHIDMNSYFASVEQQANPFLRGKPVGVCAYLSENGCIIASSIEAKKVGIKTGCRVRDARQLYPKVILIQNDPAKYRSTTEKIFTILKRYTNDVEPYSIDEAFLDLTGHVSGLSEAGRLASRIQHEITTEVGEWLRSSIGLSFTRFLAKLASDYTGPQSVLPLSRDDLFDFYERISLTDIWGINHRLEARLNALGIFTPGQLYRYPVANLLQSLGKPGYYLWANLHGLELGGVQQPTEPKSIGHSYCVPIKTADPAYHRKIFMKLCEKVGRRLRQQKRVARGISVYWSYSTGGGFSGHQTLPYPIADTANIFHQVMAIFRRSFAGRPISMLAVTAFRLVPHSHQLSLWSSSEKKNTALSNALDEINDVYGEFTIYLGSMWETDRNAPDRIGFRKTQPAQAVELNRLEVDPLLS